MKLIPLTQGKFTIVDDEDYDYLMQWKWHFTSCGYASRSLTSEKKRCYLHKIIMNNKQIDHVDGNRLNNQKSNLRECTHSQNMRNRKSAKNSTSKYLGVSFAVIKTKLVNGNINLHEYWRACIKINGKSKSIGHFKNEIEAAKAYDKMAKIHHGEFANLNFK